MTNFFFDAALIVALTELVKRAFGVKARYLPLFAIAFGVALAFFNGVSRENFVIGLVTALTSSGLYSSVKSGLGK